MSAQRFVVSPAQVGQRLDRVLANLTSQTRSHIKLLIDQARVRVAGKPQKAGHLLRSQEEIELLPLPAVPSTVTPQEIPLDMLYEDEFLAAINKPAGMVVHPAPGQWDGTVVNALLFRWGRTDPVQSFRPGIVHRLDKDTSGVLLVAKDERTLARLTAQFKAREVHKTYMAVVVGRFSASAGEIAWPIGRHPVERKKMSIHARRARAALSRYQVVAEHRGVTLVRLFPETGRTHQLRVHLAALGHPIVGDQVYGAPSAWRTLAPLIRTFPRQALHAQSLQFRHPVTDAVLMITAPYPADLAQLLTVFAEGKPQSAPLAVDSTKKIEYGRTQFHRN
ncbi:MAG: RluA family pseudouridine synthase [Deltaproteobacteria bacterium]|nr:RluA family pseudouridine synthase [Deltaproteobacteria bacterium]